MQRLDASDLLQEAPQHDEITEGTGKELESVTLVIALPGKDCVVVGSDTFGFAGGEQEYTGYHVSKIKAFANRWIIGTAETNIGSTLLSRLDDSDFQGDYWSVVETCKRKTADLYKRSGYFQPASFLFCGLHKGTPEISVWRPQDGAANTTEHVGQAIGITGYGMHLANAYLQPEMSEEQLKLLAHFCVSSVAKQDPRVKGPVELGVMNKNGARICESEEIARYAEEADKIYQSIRERFSLFR